MKAGRRGGILWVTRDNTAPHPYLVEACRRAGGEVRELRWAEEFEGQRPLGRFVEPGRPTAWCWSPAARQRQAVLERRHAAP